MVKKVVKRSKVKAVSPVSKKIVDTDPDAIKQADEDNINNESRALFHTKTDPTIFDTMKKFSPIFVPLLAGLMTYFYLVFFVFYPDIIIGGHYMKLLLFIMSLFLLGGICLYAGLRSQQIFVRLIGFVFVFVVFSFLVLFILLSNTMMGG